MTQVFQWLYFVCSFLLRGVYTVVWDCGGDSSLCWQSDVKHQALTLRLMALVGMGTCVSKTCDLRFANPHCFRLSPILARKLQRTVKRMHFALHWPYILHQVCFLVLRLASRGMGVVSRAVQKTLRVARVKCLKDHLFTACFYRQMMIFTC